MNGLSPMVILRNSLRGLRKRPLGALVWLPLGMLIALLTGCSGGGETEKPAPTNPPHPPAVQFSVPDGADNVSPTGKITATVERGKITRAVMTNADGKEVANRPSPDGTGWSVGEPLGYGKEYTVELTVQGEHGPPVTRTARFNTVSPDAQSYVSMNPSADGETVGVGQPLAFYFSEDAPAPDKKRAEEAIRVRTEPEVEGGFYWFNNREVHWRPKEYFQPGTKVSVDVETYGKDLGNGVWGQEDRHMTLNIGDAVVLRADGQSHQMSVEVNGKVQRTIPVALGKPSYPSNNGVHVVSEHHQTKHMDSASYGLAHDEGGYSVDVKWAVRISNGGEFLHAAPWSVGDQGQRNVSHGCINMSNENAEWVFNLLKKGDLVIITNSGGPDLRSWDGFGDWQIPWEEWSKAES